MGGNRRKTSGSRTSVFLMTEVLLKVAEMKPDAPREINANQFGIAVQAGKGSRNRGTLHVMENHPAEAEKFPALPVR
eukprot:7409705-Pyramimonas_sp.AAC.1